uniref:Uncharacterized protein n=1 Tax=viral metagenome TaxID=1070528 RepID=A0A6H1ZKX4_9ZZZZ
MVKKAVRINIDKVEKLAQIIHSDLEKAKFSFSVIELLYASYLITARMEQAIRMSHLQRKVLK